MWSKIEICIAIVIAIMALLMAFDEGRQTVRRSAIKHGVGKYVFDGTSRHPKFVWITPETKAEK